jgi:PAS domain S-box-containing protein
MPLPRGRRGRAARRDADSARDRRDARLRAVLDATPDAMWCTTVDGQVTEWSTGAEELLGFTREEILGQRFVEETIPALERDRIASPALQRILRGDVDRVTFVTRRRTKAGRTFPVETHVAAMRDADGAVRELVATGRDVTVPQLAAAAARAVTSGLRAEEVIERLSRAVQPFVPHDAIRVVEVTRDAHWRLLREETRVPLGAPAVNWVNGARGPLCVNDVQRDVVPLDEEVLPPWTRSLVAVPLRGGGRVIGVLVVTAEDPAGFDDRAVALLAGIADAVAAALRNVVDHASEVEAAERLARLEEQRSTFVRVVAHEIRTPLYGVQLAADVLAAKASSTELDADPAFRRMLEYLHDGVRHVQRFIADVVEFYDSAVPGGIQCVPVRCDIEALLHRVCDDPALGDTARIRLEVRGRLGTGMLDDVRVGQLVRNLVSNALKFTPSRAPVDVRAARDGDELVIDVADSGIGIEEGALDVMFEPFTRPHGVMAGDPAGSGLGLWVAQRIAEAHGGRIWVDSVPGAGSTFHVRLDVGSNVDRPRVADVPVT